MKARPVLISLLLFGSGMSALIYQTVWLREFRLIFGCSTSASAAVLAIFMGGLGAGSIVLGAKVDKMPRRPLRFYALLELFVTISAAASPFLIPLVRAKYVDLGGVTELGALPATGLRLLFSLFVLIVPTFLMGGTLPAAGRVAEKETDISRRKMALVYGANTLGAVAGVVISTFYLLEHFGNRITLWLACGLNLLVALIAFAAFLASHPVVATSPEKIPDDETARPPVVIVLLAATIVGFVFLLMELVWYRMMAPLLGGSTFTFGLLLAIALLGIGLGSFAYAFFGWERRPRLSAFALTCAAEAFFIAAPFALGDRIAVLALLLRPLGAFGFYGHVAAWSQIGAIVVLPAAFFAGVQFPMLIALLGKGRERIGWHTGLAYACNTAGAIAGSLAGGFGLLPLLSATGAWKFAVFVLAGLAAIIWIVSLIKDRSPFPLIASVILDGCRTRDAVDRGPDCGLARESDRCRSRRRGKCKLAERKGRMASQCASLHFLSERRRGKLPRHLDRFGRFFFDQRQVGRSRRLRREHASHDRIARRDSSATRNALACRWPWLGQHSGMAREHPFDGAR